MVMVFGRSLCVCFGLVWLPSLVVCRQVRENILGGVIGVTKWAPQACTIPPDHGGWSWKREMGDHGGGRGRHGDIRGEYGEE
jgi:hypothetical protein